MTTPAEDEDKIVAALLRAAGRDAGGPEIKGAAASFDPYKSLAASRGVSLETVLRALLRDTLADVVAMPPRTPNRPSRPLRAADPDGLDDGTSCGVTR